MVRFVRHPVWKSEESIRTFICTYFYLHKKESDEDVLICDRGLDVEPPVMDRICHVIGG